MVGAESHDDVFGIPTLGSWSPDSLPNGTDSTAPSLLVTIHSHKAFLSTAFFRYAPCDGCSAAGTANAPGAPRRAPAPPPSCVGRGRPGTGGGQRGQPNDILPPWCFLHRRAGRPGSRRGRLLPCRPVHRRARQLSAQLGRFALVLGRRQRVQSWKHKCGPLRSFYKLILLRCSPQKATFLASSFWTGTTKCDTSAMVYAGTATLANSCLPSGSNNGSMIVRCYANYAVFNYFSDAQCTVTSSQTPQEMPLATCGTFFATALNRTLTQYRLCLRNEPGETMIFPAVASPSPPPPPPPPEGPPVGAIVGGVVGGLAAIGLLAGFLIWRRKHSRTVEAKDPSYHSSSPQVSSLKATPLDSHKNTFVPVAVQEAYLPTPTPAVIEIAGPGKPSVPWNEAAMELAGAPVRQKAQVPYLEVAMHAVTPAAASATSLETTLAADHSDGAAHHDVRPPVPLPAPPSEDITDASAASASPNVLAGSAASAASAPAVVVASASAEKAPHAHPIRSSTDPASSGSPPQPPHVSKLLVAASEITILRDKKIGEGSFGVVHQGLLHGNIPVAVKSLKGDADSKVLKAFFREVGTWEGLVQRNVLPLMAYCADPPMMVTDYCPDGNLRKFLDSRSWPQDLGLRLLLDVARGMVYLHGLGILHGDLKSLNVLVDSGKALIADFGLSKVRSEVGRSTAGTVGGPVSGTPGFLAPELVGGSALHKPADVYAFGMVCYEVASKGRFPFEELMNPALVLYNVAVKGVRPERPDGVPDALWHLMERCWDQDPKKRPAFGEVADELAKIVGS